jgi:hypothetical protein
MVNSGRGDSGRFDSTLGAKATAGRVRPLVAPVVIGTVIPEGNVMVCTRAAVATAAGCS